MTSELSIKGFTSIPGREIVEITPFNRYHLTETAQETLLETLNECFDVMKNTFRNPVPCYKGIVKRHK